VRRAAVALSRAVERRAPEIASSKWWKEERHGVFLDYNQNAKDRTTCAAYSVRPVPGARVSAPLCWSEVPDCDPAEFTIFTMPKRFTEIGNPYAGMNDAPGSLQPLLELAARDKAAQAFHGCSTKVSSRYGMRNSANSSRFALLKLAQTPTCCSAPELSNSPSSKEPTSVRSPFLCHRKPATTQSQSRSCLTLSITRLSGSYVPLAGFAIIPSRPAPSKRRNQSSAIFRSRVAGVRWMGGGELPSSNSSSRLRISNGSWHRLRSPRQSRSKNTTDAGVCKWPGHSWAGNSLPSGHPNSVQYSSGNSKVVRLWSASVITQIRTPLLRR
jgi:hypothetical protein